MTGFDGAQDYDLALRATESTTEIAHIPRNLYHWRILPGSTAAGVDQKTDAWAAGQRALTEALDRRGINGDVEEGLDPGTYNINYEIEGQPKVGIIIPTRDRYELISECVAGITQGTSWPETEVLVVNNESSDPATLKWMDAHPGPVIDFSIHHVSYARMMNMAAEQMDCDLLLFLNCDITIVNPDWLQAMIGHAQQQRVGAVGAKPSFRTDAAQHEGITVGVGGVAVNTNSRILASATSYATVGLFTAACLMVRPECFWEVGGFEERLRVAFNDVDLTMRIHQLGYDLIYQPNANLLHQESALRGSLHPMEDENFFRERWGEPLRQDDPYYNPRLSRHAQYYFSRRSQTRWLPRGHPLA